MVKTITIIIVIIIIIIIILINVANMKSKISIEWSSALYKHLKTQQKANKQQNSKE